MALEEQRESWDQGTGVTPGGRLTLFLIQCLGEWLSEFIKQLKFIEHLFLLILC